MGSDLAPVLLPRIALYPTSTTGSGSTERFVSPIEGLTGVGEDNTALPNPLQTTQQVEISKSALESDLHTRNFAKPSEHQDFAENAVNTYLDYAHFEEREYLSDTLGVDVYV